jgi:hypothetical protein
MKLHAHRPFLLDNRIVAAGEQFETQDLHGRELIEKKIAGEAPPPGTPKPSAKAPGKQEPESTPAEKLVAGNAADINAAIADVTDVELLQAALAAEAAGKDRKGVAEALTAAIDKLSTKT